MVYNNLLSQDDVPDQDERTQPSPSVLNGHPSLESGTAQGLHNVRAKLPTSVSVAEVGGTVLYVIGTAHVSSQSVQDVRRTIRLVRPQLVMVELCATRGLMFQLQGPSCEDDDLGMKDTRDHEEAENTLGEQKAVAAPSVSSASSGLTIPLRQLSAGVGILIFDCLWWIALPWLLWFSLGRNSSTGWSTTIACGATLWCLIGTLRMAFSLGHLKPLAHHFGMSKNGPSLLGLVLQAFKEYQGPNFDVETFFRSTLSLYLSKVGQDLNMEPGAEFHAAMTEGERIHAKIIFGDRPARITLQRLWSSLTPLQKVRVLLQLLLELSVPHTADMVENMKTPAVLEEMSKSITQAFPALANVLIAERDKWMAHELAKAHLKLADECQGAAMNGVAGSGPEGASMAIVAVVGMSHQKGVIREWSELLRSKQPLPAELKVTDPGPPYADCLLDYALLMALPVGLFSYLFASELVTAGIYALALVTMMAGACSMCRRRTATSIPDRRAQVRDLSLQYRPVIRRLINTLAIRWGSILSWENPAASVQVLTIVIICGETLGRCSMSTLVLIVCLLGITCRVFQPELLHHQRHLIQLLSQRWVSKASASP